MGKKECKRVLENIYNLPFRKTKLNNLEIDLYNNFLMLGVQFNGKHHYEFVPRIHKNFRDLQKEDDLRKQLCKKAGIKLISIPYNTSCVSTSISLRLGKNIPFCHCKSCEEERELFIEMDASIENLHFEKVDKDFEDIPTLESTPVDHIQV